MWRRLIGSVVVLLLVAVPAFSVTKDWNDGTGNWSNGANWTPAGVPGASDDVNIVFSDDVARTITYDYAGPAISLATLDIDMTGAGTNATTLSMTANALTTNGGETIGASGRGVFDQSGGIHTANGLNFEIGGPGTGIGIYNLSGTGTLLTVGNQIVGGAGSGTFNQSSGSNSIIGATHQLYLGASFTGSGNYNLSGGSLLAGENEEIGYAGDANFDHSGGTNSVSNSLYVGGLASGNGTYSLSGTGQLSVSNQLVVGNSGIGTFNQTGGTNTVNGASGLRIGATSSAMGSYNLSGGTLTVNGFEIVGNFATGDGLQFGGNFQQTGGIHQAQSLFIGSEAGSTGVFALNGGTYVSAAGETIGNLGIGLFSQSGGAHTSTADINIGAMAGSNGTYTINAGTANAANIYVGGRSSGAGGTGVLTVSGSSTLLTVPGTITVYNTPNSRLNLQSNATIVAGGINLNGDPSLLNWSSGTLHITNDVAWDSGGAANSTSRIFGSSLSLSSNRTLRVTGNETIGGNGTFSLTLNNGNTHTVSGNMTLKTGGTLTLSTGSTLNYGSFTHAGGTITGSSFRNSTSYTYQSGTVSSFFVNAGTVSFGSSLSLSGGMTNEASFTVGSGQTLSVGGNGLTNTGSFTVNGGTIASGAPISNAVGGTITAHGVITPTVQNHGTLIVDGVLSVGSSSTNDGIIQGIGTLTGLSTLGNSAGGVINSTTPGGTLVLTNFSNNNLGGTMNVGPTSTLSISSSWTNAGVVNLQGAGSRLSGGILTNNGTIQGFGTIASTLATSNNGVFRASGGELTFTGGGIFNSSQSQFQILAGSTAMFLQGMLNNSGTISLTGGAFDNNNRTLQNIGTINGHGTLRTGGLTNTTGRVISVGGGDMDVLGSVINQGIVSIQSGRSAYFFGPVSGSGSFTGTGTAVFLNSLSPGSSPALVSFAGGATLVGGTSLVMELGGTTAGTGYDKIDVEGQLALGGVLSVSRINAFMPSPGDSFDLLDWGSLAGTFSSLSLPTLSIGVWDTSQLYTSGVLSVVLAGDFNHDFVVDAADYVVWRKGLGTIYTQDDYNVWRAHYGDSFIGSGSGGGSDVAAVPEPGAFALFLSIVASAAMLRRGRLCLLGRTSF